MFIVQQVLTAEVHLKAKSCLKTHKRVVYKCVVVLNSKLTD